MACFGVDQFFSRNLCWGNLTWVGLMMIRFDGIVLMCFVFEIYWICFYQGGGCFFLFLFCDVDVFFCMCVWGGFFGRFVWGFGSLKEDFLIGKMRPLKKDICSRNR